MPSNGSTEARKLRSRLNHPIIDADGHWLEYGPVMREEFRRIGGDAAVEALATADFFKGTVVEKAAAEALARPTGAPAGR